MNRSVYFLSALMIMLICFTCSGWQNSPSPVDLQQQLLQAESLTDSSAVLDQLEQYYVSLSIPDSLRQHIAAETKQLLDQNMPEFEPQAIDGNDTDPEKTEQRLQAMTRNAIILKAQKADDRFTALIARMYQLQQHSARTYRRRIFQQLQQLDNRRAQLWLMAELAQTTCRNRYENEKQWREAELYAALAWQYLQNIDDPRLKLDIIQRLQVILTRYRSLYALSGALAEKYIRQAEQVGYTLRAIGLQYNYAQTLNKAEKNIQAMQMMENLLDKIDGTSSTPFIEWYRRNSLLRAAEVRWKLGDYRESLEICTDMFQRSVNKQDSIALYEISAKNNEALGDYEIAEKQYLLALGLAHNWQYGVGFEITILNNLGSMFFNLTEYVKALDYFNQALELIEKHTPENHTNRSITLLNIAQTYFRQGRQERSDSVLTEANRILEQVHLPSRRAQLKRQIAKALLAGGAGERSAKIFKEAIKLYDENGLKERCLATQLDLAAVRLSQNQFSQAEHIAREILSFCSETGDEEKIVQTLAMLSQVQFKKQNMEQALKYANQLTDRVEDLSSRFRANERLIAYRQKIYPYLTKCVSYEIAAGRIDSAFLKLDYAKGYPLRRMSANRNNISKYADYYRLLSGLRPNAALIDYFLTPDTLYAFLMYNNDVRLLCRPCNYDSLKRDVRTYLRLIRHTVDIYRQYDPAILKKHFAATSREAHRLFLQLLDWKEIILMLDEIDRLYIIPDDFLYELPFATLVTGFSGRTRFLVEKTACVYLPAASFARHTQNFIKDEKNLRVLYSVDPAFSGSAAFAGLISKKYPLAGCFSTNKIPVEKTTVLSQLARPVDMLILINHGYTNISRPGLSSIKLFVRQKNKQSGDYQKLQLDDFARAAGADMDLVMLIGCETALGKLYLGSGIFSLQHEFLMKGARRVLGTFWKIDARFVMPQMARLINDKEGIANLAQTMRKIQLESIEKLANDHYHLKPHPYFWGGYTLVSTTL